MAVLCCHHRRESAWICAQIARRGSAAVACAAPVPSRFGVRGRTLIWKTYMYACRTTLRIVTHRVIIRHTHQFSTGRAARADQARTGAGGAGRGAPARRAAARRRDRRARTGGGAPSGGAGRTLENSYVRLSYGITHRNTSIYHQAHSPISRREVWSRVEVHGARGAGPEVLSGLRCTALPRTAAPRQVANMQSAASLPPAARSKAAAGWRGHAAVAAAAGPPAL